MGRIVQKNIPSDTNNIVVFVHGLGVRWDSRGMFTEIVESLPINWGSLLFDLYDVKVDDVFVIDLKEQISRLNGIIKELKRDFPDVKLHIIAHSKGCIVTALAQPIVKGKVIFLAPPEKFGSDLQKYFEEYPGTKKSENELTVPRKDGTNTHIPLRYFDESTSIDAQQAVIDYSNQQKLIIIQTLNDEVIGKTTYSQLLGNDAIDIYQMNSDHNFTGQFRTELLNELEELLK